MASNMVDRTSIIAMLNIRILWAPSPGTPNMFLYLHKPESFSWVIILGDTLEYCLIKISYKNILKKIEIYNHILT